MATGRLIEAAGGVLWRPSVGGLGVEVALVHRPKYDDWSVPKGKLEPGEHPVLGAIREVLEETGHAGVPGRPLGETRYLKDGEPKRSRYWALRVATGAFAPNAEVDQLMWLPPREAQQHLHPDRDRAIVAAFARDPDPTWPVLFVRHASAGERSAWAGPDRERPLDDLGRRQAQALVPLLSAYRVARVLSADVLRCLDTVGPYAARHRLTVHSEPLMSETGFAAHAEAAVERLVAIMSVGEPTVVCSQGKAMPDLVEAVCRRFGCPVPADATVRKGGYWVLHLAANGKQRMAAIERFDPPA